TGSTEGMARVGARPCDPDADHARGDRQVQSISHAMAYRDGVPDGGDRRARWCRVGADDLQGLASMSQPPRIVIGISDTEFDRAAEGKIIHLAAASVAAMAAIGNDEPHIAVEILQMAAVAFLGMGAADQARLNMIAEEFVDCAKKGKQFVALARFKP